MCVCLLRAPPVTITLSWPPDCKMLSFQNKQSTNNVFWTKQFQNNNNKLPEDSHQIYCIDAVNGEPDTGDLEINLKHDYLFFSFDNQWAFM